MLFQVSQQCLVVRLPAVFAADAVDVQLGIFQAQFFDEGGHQRDQLHLGQGTLGSHKLHAELVVLTKSSALGLLITERLGHII